jgi:hypothetical protein
MAGLRRPSPVGWFALVLLLAGGAQAANLQTAVVPPQFAAIDHEGYGGTLVPPVWLQQVYGASLLPPDVILIEALRFRRDRLVAPLTEGSLDLRLSLSTTTKAPDGLSSIRPENLGPDETVVFEGVLNVSSTGVGSDGGPNPFDIEIPFAEVFRYDPQAGNLLLDFRVISGTEGLYVDGSNATDDQASRVFGPLEETANTFSDTGADIIELVYQWADPPEDCVPIPSGVVGWWRAEGTVEDSADVFQGTLLGGGAYAAGRVGLGWDLTVPWSHVRVTDVPALRFTQALTVELWVKPQQTGTIRSLVDKWDAVLGPNQASYGLGLDTDGTPYFVVSPSGLPMESTAVFATNAPAPANVWSHVAATYDGLMLRIYVDGQLKGTQPYDLGIFSGTGDLGIGGVVGGVAVGDLISPLGGFIDEVGLYRRPLAPQEIAAIYEAGALGKCDSPPSRVPLARWGFDATDGWVAEDSIGTLHGALSPAGAQFVIEGVRGNALRLVRGEGGHVSMGDALDFAGAFTLVTWVKTAANDTTETTVLLGKYQTGSVNGYYLGLNRAGFIGQPGKALFVASDDPGQELVSASSVNDGQWHQVVAVYDAGREKAALR